MSAFDSTARGLAEGIRHVHASIEAIHIVGMGHSSADTIVQSMRFVIACGKELASLAEAAKRFARSAAGSVRPQLALHRLAVTQVLLLRLKQLDGSVRRLADHEAASNFTRERRQARSLEEREKAGIAAQSTLLDKAAAILSRKVAFRLSMLPAGRSREATSQEIAGTDAAPATDDRVSTMSSGSTASAEPPRTLSVQKEASLHSAAAVANADGVKSTSSGSRVAEPLAVAASASGQLRQDVLQRADDAFDARELERTMRAVSGLVDVIAGHLVSQADSVNFILEAAVESRDNIRSGNRELRAVTERPNTMRDFAVALLLILSFALLLLDWWSRG